jgi:alkyl hydroperoxide reductase subunit F
MYDLVVVGGGPAGLTAAIYAIRKRLNVFVVSQDLGGKTNYDMQLPGMDTYRVIRGVEVVEKFWRELDYLNFARRLARVERIAKRDDRFSLTLEDGDVLEASAVIYATGSRVRHLNVPGELEFLGQGLSYSAVSYAPLFVEKRATVVGDGPLALRAVAELAQVAETVHFVSPSPALIDSPFARRLVDSMKVVLWSGHKVTAFEGNGFVSRVRLQTNGGMEKTIETDGVFIEMGLIPNTEPLQGLVDLDDEGRVVIDMVNRTSCEGLFAAGDVTNAIAEQVLIAVGEGAKAALSAYDYLIMREP